MPTETLSQEEQTDLLQRDPELRPHLEALGLETIDQYIRWCIDHGFSPKVKKHWRSRCKERYAASQTNIGSRLANKKRQSKHPRDTIRQIFAGDISEEALSSPHLIAVRQYANRIACPTTKSAFEQLLLRCLRSQSRPRGSLISTHQVHPGLPHEPNNHYVAALARIAQHHAEWLRPLNDWRVDSRNVKRQFRSLSQHLFAKYPTPAFLDSVWFEPNDDMAMRLQRLMIRIGAGESLRKLDLPAKLTRKGTRYFLSAPEDYTVLSALRWGQLRGAGCSNRTARDVLGSCAATDFANDDFWDTVWSLLAAAPMFDPGQVSPLLDYLRMRRFEAERFPENEVTGKAFTMEGRTASGLLRKMNQWHGDLRKSKTNGRLAWQPTGIEPVEHCETDPITGETEHWSIVELLSSQELHVEGQALRHCVASYDRACAGGATSIWSVGVQREDRRRRVLTIEVCNRTQRIRQVRGRGNRLPKTSELRVVNIWAQREGLQLPQYL